MSSGEDVEPKRRIFVGSIPGHLKQEELIQYFSAFGEVLKVKMFFRDGSTKLNKGYCHLVVRRDAEEKILKTKHIFEGRTLFVAPYVSGRKLDKYNQQNNARRIVIRNLPASMTQDMLHTTFSRYGRIEVAYVFSTHSKMKVRTGLMPTGSVQFSDSKVARALIDRGVINVDINNEVHTLCIYPFIHNYNELKDCMPNQPQFHEQFEPDCQSTPQFASGQLPSSARTSSNKNLSPYRKGRVDDGSLGSRGHEDTPEKLLFEWKDSGMTADNSARKFVYKTYHAVQRRRILATIHKYKPTKKAYYYVKDTERPDHCSSKVRFNQHKRSILLQHQTVNQENTLYNNPSNTNPPLKIKKEPEDNERYPSICLKSMRLSNSQSRGLDLPSDDLAQSYFFNSYENDSGLENLFAMAIPSGSQIEGYKIPLASTQNGPDETFARPAGHNKEPISYYCRHTSSFDFIRTIPQPIQF